MSVENFLGGLDKLSTSIEKVREKKEKRKLTAEEKAARKSLAATFSESMEGQTAKGQMLSQGLSSGLIDTKSALGEIPEFTKDESLMMLHSYAVTIKDPEERRIFMDKVNVLTKQYGDINEMEAYYKSRGKLRAKAEFEGGGSGGGGGGRGGGGGTESPAPSTELKITEGEPGEEEKIPYTVKLNDFSGPLRDFLENDPTYSDPKKTTAPGEGTVKQPWASEEKRAFRSRLNKFLREQIDSQTDLGEPGFEQYAEVYAAQATNVFEQKGMAGFLNTGNTKDGITTRELNITERVPMSILFPVKRETKGKNKGKIVGEPKLNKAAGKKLIGDAKNKLPPWLSNSKAARKTDEKQSAPIAGSDSFYLEQK